MKPSQIASLANHILEHGVSVKTREERLLTLTAIETVLSAEVQGRIRMTRKEVRMIEGLKEFITKILCGLS